MLSELNHLGQQVGLAVPGWVRRPDPPHKAIEGIYCRLEPLDADVHARALYDANREDPGGGMWTYIPLGPYRDFDHYYDDVKNWLRQNWCLFAIFEEKQRYPSGVALYMGLKPEAGSIEIGVMYSPRLQRTTAATEAMYLLMRRAFEELGYRRYEWKCDALNETSMRAARRLGFQFEGVFRQADVLKGRSRDTAWFSIIDREWLPLRASFERWLAPENFDGSGRQRKSLLQMRTIESETSQKG